MNWQAFFFDFDGVILDSVNVKTEAYAAMFEPYGQEIVDRVVEHHLQHGGVSRFEKFRIYYGEFLNQPINESRVQELAGQFSDLALKKVMVSPYMKGAKETLEEVARLHCPAYVVSGTPEDELQYIVKELNLTDFFRVVRGAPTTKKTILEQLLKEYSHDPSQCLMYGDAMTDYEAAKAVRMPFMGIVKSGEASPFPPGTRVSDYVCIPENE